MATGDDFYTWLHGAPFGELRALELEEGFQDRPQWQRLAISREVTRKAAIDGLKMQVLPRQGKADP